MVQPVRTPPLTRAPLDAPRRDVPSAKLSEDAYLRLALEDDRPWELVRGVPREKPEMSWEHNDIGFELAHAFRNQLNGDQYRVRFNAGRLRRSAEDYYIPDVIVIPRELFDRGREQRPGAEYYPDPLPFVAEIWSPSTGTYDVETKLGDYQQRGDREIWRVHVASRTVTAWRRQADGSYTETVVHGGTVELFALPGVTIDLDALFDFR